MIRPARIRLEASSVCQLRCPSCPAANEAVGSIVGRGFLRFNDFKRTLDENPWVSWVELSNYGEIFLNPSLLDMLRFAFSRKVRLTASNGVNLNTVESDVLDGLVKYRFQAMTCSIDGATSETYRKYRVNGDFDVVIRNIERINRIKRHYQSSYPSLTWQFVVMGHNLHEISLARQLAHNLGMEFRLKLTWDDAHSPIPDRELVRREVGAASREEFRQRYGLDYMQRICHQLWDQPQINWDGRVLGCCRNFWGTFGGSAFQEGLLSAINVDGMQYARQMLLGKRPARNDIPCTACQIYQGMRASGRWLNRGVSHYAIRAFKKATPLCRLRRLAEHSMWWHRF
jgi:MoaA/NifB/PqqE/SkfB family radical SAM enzyme